MSTTTSYSIKKIGEQLFKGLWLNRSKAEIYRQLSLVFGDDTEHADRMYEYMQNEYFLPSSPVISNVPYENEPYKGAPISCYLSEVDANGLSSVVAETAYISKHSGGLGTLWSKVPSMYTDSAAAGVIPQVNVQGNMMKYCGGIARKVGSMCAWLHVHHPDIENYIVMRMQKPTTERAMEVPRFIHHGIVLTDDFMNKLETNGSIELIEPTTGKVVKKVKARPIFDAIISTRFETGEPLIMFEGNANRAIAPHHKQLGFNIRTTNLCTEITLITGPDHNGINRTAVCCLSSINLAKRSSWVNNPLFMKDIARFMDNILTYFNVISSKYKVGQIVTDKLHLQSAYWRTIEHDAVKHAMATNHPLANAIYSAWRSRDIGIGVTGLQTLFQNSLIPIEINGKLNPVAKELNIEIFKDLRNKIDAASQELALERGACPDVLDAPGTTLERLSYKLAIAPTTVISAMMNSSPGVQFDPPVYVYKNQTVSTTIYNAQLKKLLDSKGYNDPNIWNQINCGNYNGILTETEFNIFKGGAHINPLTIIEMASDRSAYICQAQSINIYGSNTMTMNTIRRVILEAYKGGVKTLYYQFNQQAISVNESIQNSMRNKCNINDENCTACSS